MKNIQIDGRELGGVQELKAREVGTEELVSFVDTSDATATAGDIRSGKTAYVDGKKIVGANTGVLPNKLDGLVDGSVTEFKMPPKKEKIQAYLFYNNKNLVSADLGGATEVGERAFYGCTKLANTDVSNVKTFGPYAFYNANSLKSLSFTQDANLGNYAFASSAGVSGSGDITIHKDMHLGDYCFYYRKFNSINIEDGVTTIPSNCFNPVGTSSSVAGVDCFIKLPTTLTSVGVEAFRRIAKNENVDFTAAFDLHCDSPCAVGSNAFQYSRLRNVSGKFSSIGSSAFAYCQCLTDVDISGVTSIASSVFNGSYLKTLKISTDSMTLGTNSYYYLENLDLSQANITNSDFQLSIIGYYRPDKTCPVVVDLRKSSFKTVSSNFISTSSYRTENIVVMLPKTITTVSSSAFAYNNKCSFYFDSPTPPQLSSTNTWTSSTNYKIFVNYDYVNAYRGATNWSAQTNYMYGYLPEGTFEVGEKLPFANHEGYGCTWYKDADMTVPATTVTDSSAIYYCVVGTQKIATTITSVTTINCTATIVDGQGDTYTGGNVVPIGAVLTITGTPTVPGYIPYIFQVNGNDFVSGNTFTAGSEDVSIAAVYYNGQDIPISPVFSENLWPMINTAFRTGLANQFWNVGDTKQVTLKDGNIYTIRIADMQSGRYTLANGGTSNGVLEFVELVKVGSTTRFQMNTSSINAGGWANSYMRSTTIPQIEALLPDDMLAAISEVNVLSGTGGGTSSGTSSSTNKLFLPAQMEINTTKGYSIGIEECPLGQFDYYKTHNTNADKIKKQLGSASGSDYFLRSPYSNQYFAQISGSGSWNYNSASASIGVSPCFAI